MSKAIEESIPSETTTEDSKLNTGISIAVALAGTFMALAGVKSGNISQAMQGAQAKQIDAWSYFQAKSTKQNLAEGTLEQLKSLKTLSPSATPEAREELDQKIASFQKKIERYESEKEEIKKEAQGWQNTYEDLNKVDDQFDLSDAAMSVGIALCGVSALVKRRSLFVVAVLFLVFGGFMGLCGFMGWEFEIPFLSQLFS